LTTDNQQAVSPANDDAPDDSVLSIEIGGKTVGARLEAAIASGGVIRRPDGKFELRKHRLSPFIARPGEFGPCCSFLNEFMFNHIYGKKAVPIGCRDCYKVKITPQTLRQLMAVKDIAESFPGWTKSGSEVDRDDNQSLYATYLYFIGLDKARAVYRKLRGKIDADAKLGPAIKAVINRGCANYERACGPSDRYTFAPALARIEEYFFSRFAPAKSEHKKRHRDAMALLEMVRIAYRIGDDTYKDFTGGKDLLPPTLSYDPDPPVASDEIASAP
jgi:hypothetical protein